MVRVLHSHELVKGAIAAVEFEGAPFGAGVSFFMGDLAPGQGPPPHTHPYPETCIVLSGRVALTGEGPEIVASEGDIVVIEPGTIHGFRAIGPDRLKMVCIHASDRFQIDFIP